MMLFQLENFLRKNIKNENFFVRPCDLLPSRFNLPASFLINLSSSQSAGSHWVSLFIDSLGRGSYFDSYGMLPTVAPIKHFIKFHCKTVDYNSKQVQQIQSKTCGLYSAVFLLLLSRGLSMNDFLNHFSFNLVLNDLVISKMYAKLDK